MTTVDQERDEHDELDLNKFNSIIDEYSSSFKNPPKKTHQLVQFCKDKGYNYKYGELNPFFSTWSKQKTSATEGSTRSETVEASLSFCDGADTTDLVLKVTKHTSKQDLVTIKSKFTELLEAFRESRLHDPASPLQFFNFINADTQYLVKYGDVNKCYNYAVKHKWFVPMKRAKKVKKSKEKQQKEEEGLHSDNDKNDDEGVEFVLEIDHERIEAEKRKEQEQIKEQKEIEYFDTMSDDEFDHILVEYNNEYENPPRTASQIMNFAKDMELFYKHKACRVAFNRWKNCRGAVMPEPAKEEEPGAVDQSEDEQDQNEDSSDLNDSEDEDEDSY